MTSKIISSPTSRKKFPTLPIQVLIGAILGIFVGIFFGDSARVLKPVGTAYVMLMQVVVYPYIICTLLSSLGRLTPKLAKRLFKRGWPIYLLLLIITFGSIGILTYAFPINFTGIKQTISNGVTSTNILNLLVPSNLFAALSKNYVPAVVVFCVLFGIMLQRVKNTNSFFTLLEMISETCLQFWRWLIKLAPYAVFALLMNEAGTVSLSQLSGLADYLILFFSGTLLLTFWVIPAVISSITAIRYRVILKELQSALIISAATTLSVLALPFIRDFVHKLIDSKTPKEHKAEVEEVINTTLTISYPFGQLGNFFIYLFILFATLYFNHPLQHQERFILPVLSFLSAIGSPSTVINSSSFLAAWLHLPNTTTELYVSVFPITRYGQVLLSVMGFAFLTILITFSFTGLIKTNYKKLFIHLILAALVFSGIAYTLRQLTPNPGVKTYNRLLSFSISHNLTKNVQATVHRSLDEQNLKPKKNIQDALFRIQKTGVLRVGYNPGIMPFSYFNNKNELVGYDVANMYALADTLGVKLVFVPFTWPHLLDDLLANKFDIAIGGIYVSGDRLRKVSFSTPYIKSPLAFLISPKDHDQFVNATQIRSIPNLRIGLFNDPVLKPLIQRNFPNAKLVIFPNFNQYIGKAFAENQIDAAIWTHIQAQNWALGHPPYTAITPKQISTPLLMAYMVNKNSPEFLSYLNYWLRLKQADGFSKKIYSQWILVHPIQDKKPRWSVIRNVLHWVK